VEKVTEGAVNEHVALGLADGNILIASITNEAIEELDLKECAPALGVVKATDVMASASTCATPPRPSRYWVWRSR
jgi:molybdopterin-binding protein